MPLWGPESPPVCRAVSSPPEEIERVVGFVKTTGEAEYSREVMDKIEQAVKEKEKGGGGKTSAEPAEAQEGRATSCCPPPWRWFWKRDRPPSPCSSAA